MSREAFRLQLQIRLNEVAKRLAEVQRHMAEGTAEQRVHAAGVLVVLKRHEAAIAAKIDRLEHEATGTFHSLTTEIEEDLDAVWEALRRLFVGT